MDRETAYKMAFDEQKTDLLNRKKVYNDFLDSLANNNKEYKSIANELLKVSSELPACFLNGDSDKLSSLQTKIKKLSEAKNAIEVSNGAVPFEYKCKICSDSGYYNGRVCRCIKNRVKSLITDSLSSNIPLNECSFENFDLKYYSEEAQNGVSPKKRMSAISEYLKNYVKTFNPNTSDNILLMGGTGLGKTHLSLSVLNELINREYDVLYFSAFNLFSELENEHFNLRKNATYESILNCDFLIIDDLGSEYLSNYGQSVLYSIINTRILSHKPTMINTNLSMRDIEEKYSARVSSRFVGLYVVKKLFGKDVRQLKAIE